MSIKWKWRIISFFSFIFIPLSIQAQFIQPVRYELEVQSQSENIHVIDTDDNGILLFKSKAYRGEKFSEWEFIKLDTSLNELWRQDLIGGFGYKLGHYKTFKDQIYLMFTTYGSYNLHVLAFDLNDGYVGKFEVKNHIPLLIHSMEITDDVILIGAAYNQRPLVLHHNRHTGKSHFLPNLFNSPGDLNQIAPHDDGSIDVVVNGQHINKKNALFIYTYDIEGKMLNLVKLSSLDNKSLQNGRIIRQDGKKIIAGTFGRKRSAYSRGLYIAEIEEGKINIRYYNYADFTNFFNYMKKRRVQRIKNRIDRRREAGKKTNFNYMLQVHDIIEGENNSFVLHAEAYYPRYKNHHTYGYGGYSSNSSNLIFDGYRYTHAVVIGFDKKGRVIWDNCFELDEVESYTIDQVVRMDIHDGKALLYYNYNNTLHTKLIGEGNIEEEKKTIDLRLKYENDVLKRSNAPFSSGVIKTNDNVFYAYGIQKIKNVNDRNSRYPREVFFINKVIYK